MHTIRVTGDYLVTAEQTLTFHDTDGFLLQQKHGSHPNLEIDGAVVVRGGGGLTGIAAPYGDYSYALTILNAAGASLEVSADTGDAYGIDVSFGHADVTNLGVLTVTALQGQAIGVRGRDDTLVRNDGHVLVQGGDAFGVVSYGGGRPIDNRGVWEVIGSDRAVGFDLREGHAVSNRGDLSVTGGAGGAVGVQVDPYYFGQFIDNAGRITVTSTDAATASVGVLVYGPWQGYGETASMTNAGRIQADYAIREIDSIDDALGLTVSNAGRLIGRVELAAGDDTLSNLGLIRGDVDLGLGDDRYDGARGRLEGVLYGGVGDDSLAGGKGGDIIWGDDGSDGGQVSADLISGGKGSDQLHGEGGDDTLIGGGGADTLSGGYGKDSFLYSAVAESSASQQDTIVDLGKYDIIDLAGIDADAGAVGDQAFVLVAALDGHAGQAALAYDASIDATRLELDTDGDGLADMVVRIDGDHADFVDFVL